MLPSVKGKAGAKVSLPSEEEKKASAQASLTAGASTTGPGAGGGIPGFSAVANVTRAAIEKYDDPDTDDDDDERRELKK